MADSLIASRHRLVLQPKLSKYFQSNAPAPAAAPALAASSSAGQAAGRAQPRAAATALVPATAAPAKKRKAPSASKGAGGRAEAGAELRTAEKISRVIEVELDGRACPPEPPAAPAGSGAPPATASKYPPLPLARITT